MNLFRFKEVDIKRGFPIGARSVNLLRELKD